MIHFGSGHCIQVADQAKALKALLESREELKDSVDAYTSELHAVLNRFMRCKSKGSSERFCQLCEQDEDLMGHMKNILALFEYNEARVKISPLVLYRGISGECVEELKKMHVIRDCGFVSTSREPKIAQEFGPDFVMTIIVPPREEYKMLFLNEQESEVLLPPGAIFVKCPGSENKYVYYPAGSDTSTYAEHC